MEPSLVVVVGTWLALSCAGCFCPKIAPIVAVRPPPTTGDALAGVSDAAGLSDVADRLCHVESTSTERDLGLRAARMAMARDPGRHDAGLLLARCSYLVADWETAPERILAITDAAIAAASQGNDPVAAYYRALNMGLKLRTQGAIAIASIGEVVKALEVARAAAHIDQGGPLRVLGILYLKAPPWPTGPGDLDRALELLADAARRFPSHPANHLFYAQALLANGDDDKAKSELERAESLAITELWGDYAGRWRVEIDQLRHPPE